MEHKQLKLSDGDEFIVENNNYALNDNSYAVRMETKKGAVIFAKGDPDNIILSSNFALIENDDDITIDYTTPNPNFVDPSKQQSH